MPQPFLLAKENAENNNKMNIRKTSDKNSKSEDISESGVLPC